ncbi:MAG: penicillin-binding transpeptidase domain-containing protein [Micrococcaceae bacterium]
MNRSIRNVAVVVTCLFALIAASLTYRQFFEATKLNADPRNSREAFKEFTQARGAILVDGKAIAESVPSNDQYKFQRNYANGPLYAPLTGFYSLIYGATELESTMNPELAGENNPEVYSQLLRSITRSQEKGSSIELTIDPKLQQIAYDAMGSYRGSVVALDPKTGNVLAMVSTPSYDPNALASHNGTDVNNTYKKLIADPNKPLYNRAISGDLYAPASTFKIITSAAALESGKYTEDTLVEGRSPITLPGTNTSLPNDANEYCKGQAQVEMKWALANSCNTAFATIGIDLGNQAMTDITNKFGFNKQLNIPLPVTPSTFPTGMDNSQLGTSSIGQWNVKETPLQIAMNTSAIANGGVIMKPNLIKNVRASDMQITDQPQPEKYLQAVSADTASKITDMMKLSVSQGVAYSADLSAQGVTVAGKTGTAETTDGGKFNLLFTGFAPADDPKIVIAVVVEEGGDATTEASGNSVAVPIATQVLKGALGL